MEVTIQPSSNWEPLAGEEEPGGRRSRGSIVKREEFAKREGTPEGGPLLKLLHGEKEVESKSFTFCFENFSLLVGSRLLKLLGQRNANLKSLLDCFFSTIDLLQQTNTAS